MRTLMPVSTSIPEERMPIFSAADSAVFGRTQSGAPWPDLDVAEQAQLRSVRVRLKELAQQLVEPASRRAVPMVSFVSTLNPNGRVPGELWSCLFPQTVGNKSCALQFAIIINETGAEICCCLGAGTSQTNASAALRDYQEAWKHLRQQLFDVPPSTLQAVESELGDRWRPGYVTQAARISHHFASGSCMPHRRPEPGRPFPAT